MFACLWPVLVFTFHLFVWFRVFVCGQLQFRWTCDIRHFCCRVFVHVLCFVCFLVCIVLSAPSCFIVATRLGFGSPGSSPLLVRATMRGGVVVFSVVSQIWLMHSRQFAQGCGLLAVVMRSVLDFKHLRDIYIFAHWFGFPRPCAHDQLFIFGVPCDDGNGWSISFFLWRGETGWAAPMPVPFSVHPCSFIIVVQTICNEAHCSSFVGPHHCAIFG